MTGADKGGRGGTIRLMSCVGVDLELALLPFFLDHHLGLGVRPDAVHLILNTPDAATPNLDRADAVCRDRGVAAGGRWIGPYTSDAMWERRRDLQARHVRPGDWVMNADVDEMHRYPADPWSVVAGLESLGARSVQGVMVDRLAPDGRLPAVEAGRPLAEQFPIRADVALSVIGSGKAHGVDGTLKLMLHRHDVLPQRGGHTALGGERAGRYATRLRLGGFPHVARPDWRATFPFQVDHYKWTSTLRDSLARRLSTPGVSPAGKEYGGKIAAHVARHDGVRLADATVFDGADPPGADDWLDVLRRLRRQSFGWRVRGEVMRRLGTLRR